MKKHAKLDGNIREVLLSASLKKFKKLKLRKNGVYGREKKNILHLLCKYKCFNILKYLIDKSEVLIKSLTKHKNSVLHYSAESGDLRSIIYLLKKEPSLLNTLNHKNQSPLHLASKNAHEDVCIFLIKKGAEVNIQDKYGWAVGHWAAANKMLDLLNFLKTKNYNFSLENNRRENILHCATWSGSIACFEFAFDHCSINSSSKKGTIGVYCKGNWELLAHILERRYIKPRSIEKSLYSIGTPLEIFKHFNIEARLSEVLAYDRSDLLDWMFKSQNLNIGNLYYLIYNSHVPQPKCRKWLAKTWCWEKSKGFLYAYSYGNGIIKNLSIGIARDLLGFLVGKIK